MNFFKKVGVLGGTGFIGQLLVQALCKQKKQVICLTHHRSIPRNLPVQIQKIPGSIVNFDWNRLREAEIIFHLARIPGSGPVSRKIAATASFYANTRLLHWLRDCQNPPLLVFVAGTLAYGSHQDQFIDETTPLTPTSFARDYAKGEAPLVHAISNSQIPGMILRPAWVYGVQSWFNGFFLSPMRRQNVIPRYGPGENWMSLISVEDCAGLMLHYAMHGQPSQTYNLFCGHPVRQIEFVRMLATLAPEKSIQKIDLNEVRRKYGKAVREAFEFSLIVRILHLLPAL